MNRQENLDRLNELEIKKHNPEFLVYSNLIPKIQEMIDKHAKGKILDLGCGNKPYKSFFNGKYEEYIGCDIVQSSVGCVDVISPATKIPLESQTFDLVFTTQVIEHVGDFNSMLDEAYRLLKNDGHIIISGPMYWPIHEAPYDFYRFTKYGFQYVLERAGFKEIEIIPNGGKWAVFGQVFFQTMPSFLLHFKFIKIFFNNLFNYLDKKYFDDNNTLNYVVSAKK